MRGERCVELSVALRQRQDRGADVGCWAVRPAVSDRPGAILQEVAEAQVVHAGRDQQNVDLRRSEGPGQPELSADELELRRQCVAGFDASIATRNEVRDLGARAE